MPAVLGSRSPVSAMSVGGSRPATAAAHLSVSAGARRPVQPVWRVLSLGVSDTRWRGLCAVSPRSAEAPVYGPRSATAAGPRAAAGRFGHPAATDLTVVSRGETRSRRFRPDQTASWGCIPLYLLTPTSMDLLCVRVTITTILRCRCVVQFMCVATYCNYHFIQILYSFIFT